MAEALDARRFLIDFGYLPEGGTESGADLSAAVRAAQEMYGLDPDGRLTEAVARVFEATPRCGRPDCESVGVELPRWGLQTLSVFIEQYPVGLGLSKDDVRSVVREALQSIQAACGIGFEWAGSPASANILMGVGRGRRAGFDGPSGTLAYAYLPNSENYRGKLTLRWDLDEPWGDHRWRNCILLLNVTAHELLHNLGLSHTNVPAQLMNPTYNRAIAAPQDAWDRPELQRRYGESRVKAGPAPARPAGVPLEKIEVCLRINGKHVTKPQQIDLSGVVGDAA